MLCKLKTADVEGILRCECCGRRLQSDFGPARTYRECRLETKIDPRDCIHHGPKIDERLCETCNGRVMIFIFECAEFGKCSDKKKFADLAGCEGCRGFTSSWQA